KLGDASVQRVLSDEVAPGGAGFAEVLAVQLVQRSQELGVENGALGVGTLGSVGKAAEITLPGGDGFGEFLLSLEDQANLVRSSHGHLGPCGACWLGRERDPLLLEEQGEGLRALVALAASLIGLADEIGGAHRLGMSGECREKASQSRHTLVQAGVVG